MFVSQTLTLHYLTDGSCMMQFSRNKEMFFVPLVFIMKASHAQSMHRACTEHECRQHTCTADAELVYEYLTRAINTHHTDRYV